MTTAEGGIRTPLLIAGPGVKGGQQVDGFTYVWDIMPTILEFAGIQHPKKYHGKEVEPMRGKSLTGVLAASTETVYSDKDFVGGELGNGMWMRQGDYKAVAVAPPYGTGEWHLYNVVDDPGETTNLAGKQPEKLNELKAAWDDYAKDVGVILSKPSGK